MTSVDHFTSRHLSEEDVARRAIYYRGVLGTKDAMCVDIINILEFRVKEFFPDFKLMIRRNLEMETAAYTTFDPSRIFVKEIIYDSALDGDHHCRLILAHELGHLLLHSKIGGSMQKDVAGYVGQFHRLTFLESSEAQANAFARHFLVPPQLAYEYRDNIQSLSKISKVPFLIASDAVRIAKRQEMLALRTKPDVRRNFHVHTPHH